MTVDEIIDNLKSPSKSDIKLITKAYDFAQKAHEGQERLSGDPYFVHIFNTAKTLSTLKLDSQTIAASLLHDILEDADVSEKTLRKEFGQEICFLVKGVTKLGKIKYRGVQRQTESLRKFFLAMAKDIRVILIRLADRLHNMQTLKHIPEEKRKRIALETLEIYAPLASRLGMGYFKGELEDLSFFYLQSEEYKKTKKLAHDKLKEGERHLALVKQKLLTELESENINPKIIDKRVKRLWSFYQKLLRNDMNVEKIHDLAALRIIVSSIEECYKTLGIIHKLWKPLPGKIKDYIALPKLNGYQSLHTTVFTDKGKIVEIQIRTEQMHQEAEYGIAAHWAYKETSDASEQKKWNPNQKIPWVQQLLQWQKDTKNPDDFLEHLRIDFFEDRVFTFTPKGDVIDLPDGATPIDFAYSIHSDIGKHASGAKINGKLVSFSSTLRNGDIVEILVQKNKKPSTEWLGYAKTTVAKKHLKASLKRNGFLKLNTLSNRQEKVELIIKADDRVGLLRDILAIISEFRINIENTASKREGGKRTINLTLRPKSSSQLSKIKIKIGEVKKVKNVSSRPKL